MPIIKHAVGPVAAKQLTLLGQVYDLAAVVKMGVVGKTAAPGRLLDDAVTWAALVPPDWHPAHAFAKRALQATTMAATLRRGSIGIGCRVACRILRAYARTRAATAS
ncbi:MAG: hypothetical protein ABW318_18490 [Vicinamibacterales bacterium]